MLQSMSWEQFMGWVAYYELEPFGEERDDLRMGIICQTVANSNRQSRTSKIWKPQDFIIDFLAKAGISGGTGKPRKPLTDPKEYNRLRNMIADTYRPAKEDRG